MKYTISTIAFWALCGQVLLAQHSFTQVGAGGTYSQDFSTFVGTSVSMPSNWTESTADFNPGGTYSNDAAYSNSNSVRALDQEGAGEYALGAKVGSSQTFTFTAQNNTGSTINSIQILWDVEQYSQGGRASTMTLSTSPSGTITGANQVTASTGLATGENLATVTVTSRDVTVSSLNIVNGATFTFVWTLGNGAGMTSNAHVGIDNVSITILTVAPISLKGFSSSVINDRVNLSFSTATEINNDYFSIERSADGAAFAEIGQVKGAGTSYEPQDYTYTDARPLPGKNYYRLRQVDFDGRFSYSPVVTATIGKSGGLSLAPVPTLNSLRVQLDEPSSEEGVWQVLDAAGRLAQSGVFPAETTDYQLNVAALPEGAYVFRLTQGQKVTVQQFRKIR